jgi:hypothetical protein
MNRVVRGDVQTLLLDPLTTPINRPPGDSPTRWNPVHLLPSAECLTPSLPTICLFTFAFSPCSGSGSLQLFVPNIGCPPSSKPKNNPDDATEKSQSMSASRRRLTPNLQPKPSPIPRTIHSNPPHHQGSCIASDLQQHPRSSTTTGQHVHHHSSFQPRQRRRPTPQHQPTSTTVASQPG